MTNMINTVEDVKEVMIIQLKVIMLEKEKDKKLIQKMREVPLKNCLTIKGEQVFQKEDLLLPQQRMGQVMGMVEHRNLIQVNL